MNKNKTNINCDTGILGKLHWNLWKYWISSDEIFTCFIKRGKKWII